MNTAEFLKQRADKSRTECEQILDVMKRAGRGFTILEMAEMTGMPSSTVVARFHNLIEAGAVEIAADTDGQPLKRACTINGLTKKIFQLAPTKRLKSVNDGQKGLFV